MQIEVFGRSGKMGSALVDAIKKHGWSVGNGSVAIDVSHPGALMDHLGDKPLVVGTTGHSEKNFEAMREASLRIPILYVPNFSFGVALLSKLARQIPDAKVHIFETHHKSKRDSPSGTALMLQKQLGGKISAKREDNVVGEHKVLFSFGDEEIEITHRAKDRKAFAEGALRCIEWISDQPPGFYTMDDVCK